MIQVKEYVNQIVTQYFDGADAIMVFGSQAQQEILQPSSDLDIIIIKEIGYCRGVQDEWLAEVKTDITVLPSVNFDLILLKEFLSPQMSVTIHALCHGKIIKDKYGQLAEYKELATQLYQDKKEIVHQDIHQFATIVIALNTLINNYKAIQKSNLEYFLLFSHIVNNLIDLELWSVLGWSTYGKTKARILQRINPELASKLQDIVALPYTEEDKIEILDFLERQKEKYTEIYNNKKRAVLHCSFFWDQKLAIRIVEGYELEEFLEFIMPDIVKSNLEFYYLQAPFKRDNDISNLVVIKGEQNSLQALENTIKSQRYLHPQFIQPSYFPLVQRFNGGAAILKVSEKFYSVFCDAIVNTKRPGKKNKVNLSAIDPNNLAINILIFYSRIQFSENIDTLSTFLNYLFDQWRAYAFDHPEKFLSEIPGSSGRLTLAFKKHYEQQKGTLKQILNGINNCITGKESTAWQNFLFHHLTILHKETNACQREVPSFDQIFIAGYHPQENASMWYILRKQFESIFLILGIDETDWSYLTYLVHAVISETNGSKNQLSAINR
nr:hypothetical protein [uncultured Chryseobacterium sp.]